MSEARKADVVTLTASVQTLVVGTRQVTLSVFRQLDEVEPGQCEPFGRVRDGRHNDPAGIAVVGRHEGSGALVRSFVAKPPREAHVPGVGQDYLTVGPHQHQSAFGRTGDLPSLKNKCVILAQEGDLRVAIPITAPAALQVDRDMEPGTTTITGTDQTALVSKAEGILREMQTRAAITPPGRPSR